METGAMNRQNSSFYKSKKKFSEKSEIFKKKPTKGLKKPLK